MVRTCAAVPPEAAASVAADAFCIIDIDSELAAAIPPAIIPERLRKVRRSMVAAANAAYAWVGSVA